MLNYSVAELRLTKKAATPSNLNRLRRNVGNNPNYQFMDAVEFHKLFED